MRLKFTAPAFSLFILTMLLLIINFSCKKIDIQLPAVVADSINRPIGVSQKFFDSDLPADKTILGIRDNIYRQEQQKPFVEEFVKYAGYPVWNKAIISVPKKESITLAKPENAAETKVIYIPLALQGDSSVNSILRATIHNADTVLSMLYHWQYKKFGYSENSDTSNNANETALLFMGFESYVFGHKNFKINDSLLFRKNNKTTAKIKITSFNQSGTNEIAIRSTISICYVAWPSDGIGGCPPGELCPEEMTCEEYNVWIDDGGGGTTGGDSTGGGDDGGGWSDDPCGGPTIPASKTEPCDGGGTGWEPEPPITEDQTRDANGYLYTRIAELQNILAHFPQALEPCDSLNIMPLETYGAMWQNVAQFTPSQSVKNRIDSIRNVLPGWIVDDYNIQSLTEAFGAIVNCDYFPVRITQMPTGYTPESLLEHFRINIDSFIDPNLGMSFGPYYQGTIFDDSPKYYAPNDASVGSLWHLVLGPYPGLDGSVVESGYNHVVDGSYQSHYFTVTTMETITDFEHPVAGNRRWGIFSDPDHPGEFNFYTMGVDRIWDPVFGIENWIKEQATKESGFDDADKLWSSLQEGMIQFITHNGGSATYYSKPRIIARPHWKDVEDYLKGDIDFPALKIKLGC